MITSSVGKDFRVCLLFFTFGTEQFAGRLFLILLLLRFGLPV